MSLCGCHHSVVLPPKTCIFCKSSSPDSLLEICVNYIRDNLDTICVPRKGRHLKLKEGINLPVEICDKLFNKHMYKSRFVSIFKARKTTRLKRVKIRDMCKSFTEKDLDVLLQHELMELDLFQCYKLSGACIPKLNKYGKKLKSLSVDKSTSIFPTSIFGNVKHIKKYYDRGYILHMPSLNRLTLKSVRCVEPNFYILLLKNLSSLTHLDLSSCSDLEEFDYTDHLVNLSSLILHNVVEFQNMIPQICKLKSLKHLDVSQWKDTGNFENGSYALRNLIESLPNLTSLDISGTHLTEPEPVQVSLCSRMSTPLHYLGLYNTSQSQNPYNNGNIPAKLIAGNADEEQLLVAAVAFQNHLELLLKVLRDINVLLTAKTCVYMGHVLHIILDSMNRYLSDKEMQLLGSDMLLQIVKAPEKLVDDCVSVKRQIIDVLLNGISVNISHAAQMKYMILILCHFKLPDDMLYHFDKLVGTLLHPIEIKSYNKRKLLQFLNDVACYADIPQKIKMGQLGVMQKMMKLIDTKLDKMDCDEDLELAWSVMWNATDGTPANSFIFLQFKGMDYFLSCLEAFPNEDDLLRDMMGLLGNVAEVRNIRSFFMTTKYLNVFLDLLDSSCDGIEVSFDAAGILAYIASDGPNCWTIDRPERKEVLEKISKTIDTWNVKSTRNIMYRTFEPILWLVKAYHTPEAQKWAIWTLANLTKVYPERYCPMIEKEGGLVLLQHLLDHFAPPVAIVELATMVIANCAKYKQVAIT